VNLSDVQRDGYSSSITDRRHQRQKVEVLLRGERDNLRHEHGNARDDQTGPVTDDHYEIDPRYQSPQINRSQTSRQGPEQVHSLDSRHSPHT
jgi:hypothetical protein